MKRANAARWMAGAMLMIYFGAEATCAAPPTATSRPGGSAATRAVSPGGTWAKSALVDRQAALAPWGMNTRFMAGYGAFVTSVSQGSPADRLGLKPGDVVLAWNGQSLVQSGIDVGLRAGANGPGPATFKIREARSGEIVYRSLP